MNGVHDMGGMHGMGPLRREKDEPASLGRQGHSHLRSQWPPGKNGTLIPPATNAN